MTKKDYIKIADIIKTMPFNANDKTELAYRFKIMLKQDNDRFDDTWFLKACLENVV